MTDGLLHSLTTVSGVLALLLLAAAAVLPARLRWLTRRMGIEQVFASHRFLGIAATLTVTAHLGFVLAGDPRSVALLGFVTAPPRAQAGTVAFAGLAALVATVRYRAARYERWRWVHVGLAGLTVVAAGAHTFLIGKLVRDPAGALLFGALGVAVLVIGVRRWLIVPHDRRAEFLVAAVREESPQVSTLTLRPATGRHTGVRFEPGQFAWLRLRRAPLAEEHPFTIASAAQDGTAPQITYRRAGDWTTGPLARVRVGDRVWLDGPHGGFTPTPEAAGIVMVAAGVGITPMLSILRTCARRGDSRPFRLWLADRRPQEALFRDELGRLGQALDLDLHEVPGRRITAELLAEELPPSFLRNRMDYLVCGGPRLVDDATVALEELGVPAARVRTERFDG